MKYLIILAGTIILLLSTSTCPCTKKSHLKKEIGNETFEILKNPHTISLLKSEKKIPQNLVKVISALFTSDQNYEFNKVKMNLFYPEETLIFKKEKTVFVEINTQTKQIKVGKKVFNYTPNGEIINHTLERI